jgi:tRNA(Ile)-lysidine synthase
MAHRLEILGSIPFNVGVAVSGGPDSMAILDFLLKGNRKVTAFHFNHGTEHGQEAERVVEDYCETNSIPLFIGRLSRPKTPGKSPEEFWRDERYKFLEKHTGHLAVDVHMDMYAHGPIITCHTLNDQVENWIFTSLHGNPRLIPYRRGNIIRPFILTRKEALVSWCDRKNVPYVTDPSNSDPKYMRSLIRTKIIPRALEVNPGLHKVIKKKVKNLLEISEQLR